MYIYIYEWAEKKGGTRQNQNVIRNIRGAHRQRGACTKRFTKSGRRKLIGFKSLRLNEI